jgi:predicted dehydrogenase
MTFVTSDVQRRNPRHYLFDESVSGAGFFNWLACHTLDLLLYILQQPVTGVTSRVGVFGGTDVSVEDGGSAILDLADGSIATFVGGYWIPRWAGESHWTIRGSQRWVHWDPTRVDTSGVLEIHGPMPQWIAMEPRQIRLRDTAARAAWRWCATGSTPREMRVRTAETRRNPSWRRWN